MPPPKAFRCHALLLKHMRSKRRGRTFESPSSKKKLGFVQKNLQLYSWIPCDLLSNCFDISKCSLELRPSLESVDDMDTLPYDAEAFGVPTLSEEQLLLCGIVVTGGWGGYTGLWSCKPSCTLCYFYFRHNCVIWGRYLAVSIFQIFQPMLLGNAQNQKIWLMMRPLNTLVGVASNNQKTHPTCQHTEQHVTTGGTWRRKGRCKEQCKHHGGIVHHCAVQGG